MAVICLIIWNVKQKLNWGYEKMRNIVYIETYKRTGSGVLLECDVYSKSAIEVDEKSYIILTNYHVIQDLNQDVDEQKDYIDLKIKDVNGEIVDPQFIKHIFIASGNNYDSSSDIAALLVIIKDCCKIVCNNNIYIGAENKLFIESEGYPHVFQNDLINRDLCLKGEVEKYNREGIGIYKILDDYHGYSDISDKTLMEGLSGAPIYFKYENKEYLIGINQSLCNIGDGKNPFKLVYFLGIHKVLDWLRSQGIILYEYNHKNVKILWIKKCLEKQEGTLLDLEKAKKVVLIGGSGAGKSSFMKALCQNGDILGAVGDGQTTRATIAYDLSTYCDRPCISIRFQSKKDFIENRKKQIQFRLIELTLCYRFGMNKKNIVANPPVYLQDLLLPLDYIVNNDFADKDKNNEDNHKKGSELIQLISKTLYLCEMGEDEEDYEDSIRTTYEKIITFLDEYINIAEKSGQGNKKQIKIQKLFSKRKLEDYLKRNEKKEPNSYYKSVMESTYEDKLNTDYESLQYDFKEVISKTEGYFDITEFYYLDAENKMKLFCDELFNKYFPFDEVNKEFFGEWHSLEKEEDIEENNQQNETNKKSDEETIKHLSLYSRISKYYSDFYDRVTFLLNKNNINLSDEKMIEFQNVTMEEKSLITKCMRKVGGNSLSGIIENISVRDSFSNDYALRLRQNKMNHLLFYDTCGIDHIERGNQTIYFRNLFNKIKGNKRNAYRSIDAIIYIKKLDSGKPTELETTLPIINGLEEATPIFCVFTAADQFLYGKERTIDQIVWNCESYEKWENMKESQEFIFPKVIENMHENDSFVNKIKAPEQVKKKIYKFLLDHMVPFSSKYQINDDDIIELNRNSLNIIFESILKDEWNIGFIPSFKNLDKDEKAKLQDAIKHDLENMFLYASRCNWENKHHSTITANFCRIYRYNEIYDKEHIELGFNRTQIDRWDNLLQQGFSDSFLSESEGSTINVLNNVFGISVVKAYSILSRTKYDITDEMGTWQPQEEKSKFREYFQEMYKNKNVYSVNVFERQEQPPQEKYGNNNKRKEFLNEHCDFHRGLKLNPEIENKMVEYIYKRIEDRLQNENKIYLNRLITYDSKFKNSIDYIEKVIKKYSNGKEASNDKVIEGKKEDEVKMDIWNIVVEAIKN